jgi:hypothetical protein
MTSKINHLIEDGKLIFEISNLINGSLVFPNPYKNDGRAERKTCRYPSTT